MDERKPWGSKGWRRAACTGLRVNPGQISGAQTGSKSRRMQSRVTEKICRWIHHWGRRDTESHGWEHLKDTFIHIGLSTHAYRAGFTWQEHTHVCEMNGNCVWFPQLCFTLIKQWQSVLPKAILLMLPTVCPGWKLFPLVPELVLIPCKLVNASACSVNGATLFFATAFSSIKSTLWNNRLTTSAYLHRKTGHSFTRVCSHFDCRGNGIEPWCPYIDLKKRGKHSENYGTHIYTCGVSVTTTKSIFVTWQNLENVKTTQDLL